MESAKASGNQLLKLISQRIDQRRRQEQEPEVPASPEVYEVPSALEPSLAAAAAPTLEAEKSAVSEYSSELEPAIQPEPIQVLEFSPEPVLSSDVEPLQVLEFTAEPDVTTEFELGPVLDSSVDPASTAELTALPMLEHVAELEVPIAAFTEPASAYIAEPETTNVSEYLGSAEAVNAVQTFPNKEDLDLDFRFPDISREYQFLDDISVPLEMDKIAEKFVSDAELLDFIQPKIDSELDDTGVSGTFIAEDFEVKSAPSAYEEANNYAFRLPPPEFAEYDAGGTPYLGAEEPAPVLASKSADIPEAYSVYDADSIAESEQGVDDPTTMEQEAPVFIPTDYHGEISTDERHFLLWQYVGGELHGDERESIHRHILNCKDCASYVWTLTKDSINRPARVDDPLPKPAVPLPSREAPFSPDDWMEADHGVDRAAYVWNLAAEAPILAETAPVESIYEGPRFRLRFPGLEGLNPKKRALIAIAMALTAITCVATVPALRGKSDSADLRAQLKALEAKSEELRKEVEAGRAVRDQLLQVQKETELVRHRYENAQGAFQKMSGEVGESTPRLQTDSFTKPYPMTFSPPPADNREIDAVLNDGNGQITMDTNGDIVGLPPLQGELRQAVRAIIKDHRIDTPSVPANLVAESGTVMSANGAARDGVMLIGPVGTMVEWTKPTLTWMPVGGAVSYKVQIRNASGAVVAQGEASAGTEWTVPDSLPAGNTYSWSVTPLQTNGSGLFPNMHPPVARFGILSKEKQEEVERVRSRYSDSNLVVGLACMKYKLYDNAAREFKTLLDSNPGSALAKKLAGAPGRRFGG